MMNREKIGRIIYEARKQKNMTQKEMADVLMVSDKTISKWERGLGVPDISLLTTLSNFTGVNIESLIEGEIVAKEKEIGNMKKTKFYVCDDCGNIVTSIGDIDISCCGKRLSALEVKAEEEAAHGIRVEDSDGELYVHMEHPMTKAHYISFIAYLMGDKLYLNKLYPEGGIDVRFPKRGGGKIYAYCREHGLFEKICKRTIK